MSTILEKAKKFVDESKIGLLITVDEDTEAYARPIGAYGNEGYDIYFYTAKETNKVKHIKSNSKVTFYIDYAGKEVTDYKSVSIFGKAEEVEKENIDNAIEIINKRFPKIKEKASKENIDTWAIYKIKAEKIKYADFSLENAEQVFEL